MFLFFNKNNTSKNAHKTLDCKPSNLYSTKVVQPNHKIVIAYELEQPDYMRETKRSSLLPQAPFYTKGTAFTF